MASKKQLATATGLLANINRLREAEKAAARDYVDAKGMQDERLIAQTHREWMAISEQLRKAEVSTPGVLSDNQKTMPVDDVEKEVGKMVNQFRVAAESLPRTLPPRLVGLEEAGIQEVLQSAVYELLEKLSTEKW